MTEKHLIWDLPLRIFHWLFAFTLCASWYTAEQGSDLIDFHMKLGYFALGLLIFRVLWGFCGPKHARFNQFLPSPAKLFLYLKDLKNGQPHYVAGHNPLGSLMVVVMIILVSLQAISGLFINDDVFSSGPYYGVMSKAFEKTMSFLHHNIFNYMLAAIVLHLLAIVYYWRVKKQNLVLPMITGKKTSDEVKRQDAIPHSKILVAIILALTVALFVYWLVVLNAPVIEEYY